MTTTLEAITAQMKKLQARADVLATKETAKVLKTIHELMARHGLTAADIDGYAGGKQRAKKTAEKTAAKSATSAATYRDPKSGATWSGRGRAPQWIATVKNRDRFLIDEARATANPASAGNVKVAVNKTTLKTVGATAGKGQRKGPQPALYRDPKSGATWSGRGRAPAWIANVKDRNKFLIADGAKATVATTAGVVSKAKAVGKKTASKSGGATTGKGQPKGPQPAKYRDPKSGATWSGRGSAPAWLSGAKDRSKFLIDGVSTAADAKLAVTNAVAKKAPTAKKTAAKKAVSARAPAKKAAAKNAVPAAAATVESGAELTT